MIKPKTSGIRRRSFLAWCGGAGLGSTLFPGTLWAQSDGGSNAITSYMIDSAARLAGLEFSESDREEMVAGINANLQGIATRRAVYIDQNIPPPLYFNPAVPGQVFNHNCNPFVRRTRPSVTRPANLDDVAFWPVTDLSFLVESRQVSSLELTQMYLGRIKRHDDILNSVTTLTEELGIAQAKKADTEIANGKYRGPLHGIPWGAKDVIAKRGYRTTWGSEAYRDQIVDIDATAVTRLEDAGAILIAKLATGEIARGDRSLGKQTRNPWKTDEGSGGSSAGPGSATAAGLVGFSMGSDTTGSILGPSRTCGVSGLRPTFGRISRYGVMPVCWSLDKIGPLCRSVEDCALVLEAVRGPDNEDLAVVDMPFNWNGNRSIDGLRVGFLEDVFTANGAANDNATLAALESLGVELTPIRLPEHADMDALQMLLVDEAAAFDELVQTGRIDLLIQDREEPEDMLMRIARLLPAVEYLQIQRLRMLMMQNMEKAMRDVDVYVAPHTGSPNTGTTSLTGHPAISVPNGFDEDGKPTGILFVGQLYGEAALMAVAMKYQDANEFHLAHPALS
jgi:Asp-tRNA(Asn)/Glu-tRNA(Gln) amidotransferase A subunit family amidase